MPTLNFKILAEAGMGEGIEGSILLYGYVYLCILAGTSIYSYFRLSLLSTAFTACLAFMLSLFSPWKLFAPLASKELLDPDTVSWQENWQTFGVAWCLVTGIAIFCVAWVIVHRVRRMIHRNPAPVVA